MADGFFANMRTRGDSRAGGYWWRATEPIPARPERLVLPPEDDAGAVTAIEAREGSEAAGRMREERAPAPPPAAPAKASTGSDLGAFRPTSLDEAPRGAMPPDRRDRSPDRNRSAAHDRRRTRPRRSRSVSLLIGRTAVLAAGLAGAALFAGASGLGRNVRPPEHLAQSLDRILVGVGLGIEEISVVGHRHTPDADIFRAVGASGASLITLDLASARRRIEALPWVESAALSRVLPGKLRIEVRERRPFAVWLDGDRPALVDEAGRTLTRLASYVPSDLPVIAGDGAPQAARELIAALVGHPMLASEVRLARRIGGRRWDLELASGGRVRLAPDPPAPSLARLVELMAETRGLDLAGQVVDLTGDGTIAVSAPASRTQSATPASAPAGARPL